MVEMHGATTASGKLALFGFLGVGLFDARWTNTIDEEWIRTLTANTTGVSRERLGGPATQ